MSRPILGDELCRALQAAGIIDQLDTITRVIIDAKAGELVHLYVCRYGDERLIDVVAEAGPRILIADRDRTRKDAT